MILHVKMAIPTHSEALVLSDSSEALALSDLSEALV